MAQEPTAAPEAGEGKRSRRQIPLWLALIVMVIALAVSALILVRVFPPLYGLLFPVELPVPDGVREIEHVKPDKGSEYWIYRTTMPGQDVAAFYENEGGTCRYSPEPTNLDDPEDTGGPHGIAQCRGSKESGGIGISWEVYIHEGYTEDEGPTIFRIYRYSSEVEFP